MERRLMSESFQVVFTGELKPGMEADQVIERFGEKFKVDREKAERLIRGARSVVLKKGLALDKAEKYLAVLQHIGMVVELDPKPAPAAPPPAPEPAVFELAAAEPLTAEPTMPAPTPAEPAKPVPGTS